MAILGLEFDFECNGFEMMKILWNFDLHTSESQINCWIFVQL